MNRGVWVAIVVSLVLLGATGCWNPFSQDDDGGGNGGRIDRKTPDNLLNFVASVYMDKDVSKYGESLDESYSFTFLEQDYGTAGVDSIKPYWGQTEDIERTGKMFSSALTYGILFDFGEIVMPWYTSTDSIFVGGVWEPVEVLCTITKPDIQVTIDEGGPELVTHLVNKSWLDITVIQDRNDPQLWTILRITERLSE